MRLGEFLAKLRKSVSFPCRSRRGRKMQRQVQRFLHICDHGRDNGGSTPLLSSSLPFSVLQGLVLPYLNPLISIQTEKKKHEEDGEGQARGSVKFKPQTEFLASKPALLKMWLFEKFRFLSRDPKYRQADSKRDVQVQFLFTFILFIILLFLHLMHV